MKSKSCSSPRFLLSIGKLALVGFFTGFVLTSQSSGQVLFTENFNDGDAATRWTVAQSGGTNVSNLAFDYSTVGIAAAPNGTGTTGLRLDTNTTAAGVSSAIVAFPNGQSFSGPHMLSFDLWLNIGVGATGTTELAIFGANHTSTSAQAPTSATPGIGPSNNGIDYTLTGDNGAARDVRVYINGAEQIGLPGGFAGGTVQGTQNAPYNESYTAPIPGNQWLQVEVWFLSDRTIFNVNGDTWAETLATTSSGNIMLGYMDIFGASVAPDTVFAVYDNVMVAVPEPSTYALILGLAFGGLALWRRRRS